MEAEKKKQAEQIAHFMQDREGEERRGGLKSKSVDISAATDISAAAREDGARWVAAVSSYSLHSSAEGS